MNNKREKAKFLVALAITLIIVLLFSMDSKEQPMLTYDQLITALKNGEIVRIEAQKDNGALLVTMQDETQKVSVVPSLDEFSNMVLAELDKGKRIEFTVVDEMKLEEMLPYLFSIVTCLLLFNVIRRARGDAEQFEQATSKVTFKDVAGLDEEREQLEEIVKFLQDPKQYNQMGAKIPKGILLYGAPGTGKTLLAKAIAGEAKVPFFQVTGSLFEEKFVGVGASRVRRLFKTAKRFAPCIVFIDEIDAVAKTRYNGKSDSEQTLNQLLAEMDGFDSSDNIIVVAATNYKEILDSAITRAGRFDRQIFVSSPDVLAREKILDIHAKNKKFAEDVSLKAIAKKTVGFSGADLANILNEAAIYAVNQQKECIENSDIEEAMARVMIGLEKKSAVISEEDKELTATHEAGHAIVSAIIRPNVKNFGISIMPRGKAGGYNYFDEPDTKYSRKSDLEKQICVMYGGRVAESIILNEISSGASNDFEVASRIAYFMVSKYGMGERLLVEISNQSDYNQSLNSKEIEEAERICQQAYKQTEEVVKSHVEVIKKLAKLLYEKEYLPQEEVEKFLKENLK